MQLYSGLQIRIEKGKAKLIFSVIGIGKVEKGTHSKTEKLEEIGDMFFVRLICDEISTLTFDNSR